MGERFQLESRFDGFQLGAYHAAPPDARRGGLVLIQEIFGVTDHIRDLADRYAEDGYETIAPAFFDRLEPGFEADYAGDGVARGAGYSQATPWDQVAGDLQAAIDALKPPVFAVGYCWGGTAAWLAACRGRGLSAVSSYYGRRIPELRDETPACPIILHFGLTDASIPADQVEGIRSLHPDVPVFVYPAGHGFASDRRHDFDDDSARLAGLRTLSLFMRNGGGRGEI
jgi:carboxymethylenebutenolidase